MGILQKLYDKYPSFEDSGFRRVRNCILLAVAVYTILLVFNLVVSMLAGSIDVRIAKVLAFIVGAFVMFDQKGDWKEWLGYVVLSWVALTLVGIVYALLIFAAV